MAGGQAICQFQIQPPERDLCRDPTSLLEIHEGISDHIVQRRDLDAQDPVPLCRAKLQTRSRFRWVVILDTLLNALDTERDGCLLRGFDELLVRGGRGRNDDTFTARCFLLESDNLGFCDVSDVYPDGARQEFCFRKSFWLEEHVEQPQ